MPSNGFYLFAELSGSPQLCPIGHVADEAITRQAILALREMEPDEVSKIDYTQSGENVPWLHWDSVIGGYREDYVYARADWVIQTGADVTESMERDAVWRGLSPAVKLVVMLDDILDVYAKSTSAAKANSSSKTSAQPVQDEGQLGLFREHLFKHAEDFSWIVWKGTTYKLSKGAQAETVKALWMSWERSGRRSGCGLSEETIAEKVGSGNSRFSLRHVFRKHPHWKEFITPAQKGIYAMKV